jgi:iron complex outermembrane recepter protein
MSGTVTPKKVLFFSVFIIFFSLSGNQYLYSQETDKPGSSSYYTNKFYYDAGEADDAGPKVSDAPPEFPRTSLFLYNQFGSFGSMINSLQAAIKTDHYGFMTSYSYQNWDGYRTHSKEYWNDVKLALRTTPSGNTNLTILGSYVNGLIKLPGSLTKAEFEQDPFRADQRSIDRDEKSIASKGRLDIRYDAKFGKSLNNEIVISGSGGIDLFQCATREYRIINSYGLGFEARYSNIARFRNRTNIVSAGTDLSLKPQRTEYYDNLGGTRGDQIEQLTSEKTSNTGFYASDRFELLPEKLFILLYGRYDDVIYKVSEQTVPSRTERRPFKAFTPKVSLDYNVLRWFALFATFNLGFESPADKELESADPFFLFNPILSAQTSKNIEAGFKVDVEDEKSVKSFRKFRFQATFYRNFIDNEIVPYEVYGDVFYRNAAKTNHFGIDMESKLVLFKELSFGISYIFSRFVYNFYQTISMETDSKGNLVQVPRDFSGNNEPAIPAHNLKLSLSYKYPVGKRINIMADLNYSGISGMWVDDANTDKSNAYHLLNAFLECELKSGHFNLTISAGLNNILNTTYAGFINTNSANNRFYAAGAPRNWAGMLNLGYIF